MNLNTIKFTIVHKLPLNIIRIQQDLISMERICCVCNKTECFYKCPVCKQSYCSAACCNVHKTSNCQPPNSQESEATVNAEPHATNYDFPTEDTVAIEKLQQLCDSEELKNCLKNVHLRDIMRAILTDANPTKAIALAMTEPIFVEMADACLKLVEPPVDEQPC